MSEDKQELRKSAIGLLKGMPDDEKDQISEQLYQQVYASDAWQAAKVVGLTVSQGMEWDTWPLIHQAWNSGKIVCVPKCDPKTKRMTFYQLDHFDQLERVYFNLLEPKPTETMSVSKEDMNALVVPGLLFDKRGYRIGFGGGFYDRFLQDFNQPTLSILSSKQLVDHLPAESFDIPVRQLLTENGSIVTGVR
ncbi:5-formyltetrahydrofolate cyclo-ligase [Lentibacillus sp. JNUCC-1]|nr:5-formyltetrahydrofolate cyclo-ligase [Lentibacillus sp. JNUCC-1]